MTFFGGSTLVEYTSEGKETKWHTFKPESDTIITSAAWLPNCRCLYQEKWNPTELKQRCELAPHEYSDPLVFRSSILVLQYSILCEFLRKKIASFITLSVSLYSKQMLHRKVILTWPWAIITSTWCNNFSFISFYGCEGFFSSFFFSGKSFSSLRI